MPLFHQDLYRLAGAAEALDGGLLDERQDAGVTLTEWADRLDAPVDLDHLDVRIVVDERTPRCATTWTPREIGCCRSGRLDTLRPLSGASPHLAGGPRMSWRLVIDTATRRTVIAVGEGAVPAAAVVLDTRDRHGARLLPHLESVLAEAGIGMADVSAIGVGTGPGSFTGLRVGLATAKTLSAMRHLPLGGTGHGRGAAPRRRSTDAPRSCCPRAPATTTLACRGPTRCWCHRAPDLESLVGDRPMVAVDVAPDTSWLVALQDGATARGLPDP